MVTMTISIFTVTVKLNFSHNHWQIFIVNKNADTWLVGLENFAELLTILNQGEQQTTSKWGSF